MITLTPKAIELIKGDTPLFIKIQIALGVTERTMYNYVKSNSEELTKVAALNQMVEHTGKPLSEIITGGKLSKLLSK